MRRLVMFVVCGACSGANAPAPILNRAAPPPKPTCSESRIAELATHLRERWHLTGALDVRCTAGTFPVPGYFVEAQGSAVHRTGVITADTGREIVPFVDEKHRLFATNVIEYATVDLDGDGVDEIVETWRRSAYGMMGSDNWIVVRRLGNRSFVRIDGPHLSVYHPELGGCTAELQLAGRTIVIRVANLPGIPPSDCLEEGTHTFALRDGAIVETHRR
jgi:hypothetical protein